ncbi:MAG TPA: zinc-binding alcohol dehydrogenase family protein [Terracidiphilus sp.]|nr:zinc-binding alcohol dehydrogenase family protein [Terracidiphilus sp.]
MHAAVVHTLGQPPRYQEFTDPMPGPDEVLVHVKAAGLHPIVKALAAGTHYAAGGSLPMVPGIDGVGVLEDGQRVYFGFARKPWGTMCERTVAPRDKCLPLPDGISDVQAAAVANPGMSAWLSIRDRAAVQPGETVLILGATGVAGQLALQAARFLGAKRVIGVGRNVDAISTENADAVIALTETEDKVREAFLAEAEQGIDVVIDYLWGRPTELLLEALAKGFKPRATHSTRLVEVGESAGKTIQLPGATLRSIDLRLMGSGFGSVDLKRILESIPDLFKMVAQGKFKIAVEPVPLAEVEAAWTRVEKGRRIVFTV